MKNMDDIFNLITGNIDAERKSKIYSEIADKSEDKNLYRKAKITWALMSSTKTMPDYKVEKSFRDLQSRISQKQHVFKLYPYMRYAAMVILLMGFSVIAYYLGKQNQIAPDLNTKYTSVVADNGQISKIILPDSTIVWLNSGTKLTYDNGFSLNNRNLSLDGQAFLQVTKNRNLPLIVACRNLNVKVLGTRFDVCAYPEENNVRVFLESGKVELQNSADDVFNYKLNPGEMAEYNFQSGKIKIGKAVAGNYSAWKDGELIFVDTPMEDVIRKLERRFDVEVIVNNSDVYKSVFNANFKSENLNEILDYIQFSCPVNYKIVAAKGTTRSKVILNTK